VTQWTSVNEQIIFPFSVGTVNLLYLDYILVIHNNPSYYYYYYYYNWIRHLLYCYQKYMKQKQQYTVIPTDQMNGRYEYKYED